MARKIFFAGYAVASVGWSVSGYFNLSTSSNYRSIVELLTTIEPQSAVMYSSLANMYFWLAITSFVLALAMIGIAITLYGIRKVT